jgi:hypothetical protein
MSSEFEQMVDEMMADALGLQGEERAATLSMIKESRARRSAE